MDTTFCIRQIYIFELVMPLNRRLIFVILKNEMKISVFSILCSCRAETIKTTNDSYIDFIQKEKELVRLYFIY